MIRLVLDKGGEILEVVLPFDVIDGNDRRPRGKMRGAQKQGALENDRSRDRRFSARDSDSENVSGGDNRYGRTRHLAGLDRFSRSQPRGQFLGEPRLPRMAFRSDRLGERARETRQIENIPQALIRTEPKTPSFLRRLPVQIRRVKLKIIQTYMKQHRFIGDFAPEGNYLEIRDEELINQMRSVLKLKPGEEVILADGRGSELTATIKSFHPKFIALTVGEKRQNSNDPAAAVILYCSLLKKENFEWVAEKATETGARGIVPVISDRTVKLNLNIGRLRKIVKEAAEQSGRGFLPEVSEIIGFDEAVEQSKDNELNIFFDPKGKAFEKPQWFSMYGEKRIGVFIGPEGGWTDREIAAAAANDFQIVSLGKLVLRAETAAIVAVYLAAH